MCAKEPLKHIHGLSEREYANPVLRSDRAEVLITTKKSKSRMVALGMSTATLLATQNLYQALKHLRSEFRSRIFWIDAICVNQEDLVERSKQVQRMSDIYT